MTSMQVFISYRHRDSAGTTRHLHDRLRQRFGERSVFLDVVSMPPGRDFRQVLTTAIDACAVMLVVIGPDWLSMPTDDGRGRRVDDPDDITVGEVGAGLERGIPVVPVLVGGAALPDATDLPPRLAGLAQRQAFRLDHESFDADTAQLITALTGIGVRGPRVGPPGAAPRPPVTGEPDEEVLRALAHAVELHCLGEASAAGPRGSTPLEVPVRMLDPKKVHERWSRIRRDGRATPLGITGTADDLAGFVRNPAHRGRVVILGEAGAGKTALALRLVLDLLADRGPHGEQPVPVFLRLCTWDPRRRTTRDLGSWMAERIAEEYRIRVGRPPSPVTGGGGAGATVTALLRQGRLLPVLDGLDEVAPQRLGDVVTALARDLGSGQPVVVTSREREYVAAARDAGEPVVARAATLVLRSPGADAVRDHLLDACGSSERSDAIREVLDADRGTGRGVITDVLRLPLYAALARVAYAENAGDPRELRGLCPEHVRAVLLDRIIPAAYPDPPNYGPDGRSYDQHDVVGWLSRLAGHLRDDCGGTRTIAWWELAVGLGPLRRLSMFGVAAILFTVCAHLLMGDIDVAAASGVLAGGVFALSSGDGSSRPSGRRWTLRRSAGAVTRFRGGGPVLLVSKALCAVAAVTTAVGLVLVPADSGQITLAGLAVVGGAAVVGFLLPVLLLAEFTMVLSTADAGRATSPNALLRQDRRRVLAFALIASTLVLTGLVPGYLLASRWFGWGLGPAIGPVQFAVIGVTFALVAALAMTAWAQFQMARVWIFVSGGPWRIMTFLHDADRRGVLRQVGGFYQFRHAALQDRLAGPHADPAGPGHRTPACGCPG